MKGADSMRTMRAAFDQSRLKYIWNLAEMILELGDKSESPENIQAFGEVLVVIQCLLNRMTAEGIIILRQDAAGLLDEAERIMNREDE